MNGNWIKSKIYANPPTMACQPISMTENSEGELIICAREFSSPVGNIPWLSYDYNAILFKIDENLDTL